MVPRMADDSLEATGRDGDGREQPDGERRDAQPAVDAQPAKDRDYERDLGVIEAITYVTRSCPSGVVIAAAERALEAIKVGGPDVLKQQAYFVLTSMRGWRGERARQVHRSLTKYIES